MDLKTQLLLIFISFLFGVIYFYSFFRYKNFSLKFNILKKFLLDLGFNFIFFLIFAFILYMINNLTLHVYILLYFFLGIYICYINVNKD